MNFTNLHLLSPGSCESLYYQFKRKFFPYELKIGVENQFKLSSMLLFRSNLFNNNIIADNSTNFSNFLPLEYLFNEYFIYKVKNNFSK
jgi:hypothetical protein